MPPAAQPDPEVLAAIRPPGRRRWPWVVGLLALGLGAACAGVYGLWGRGEVVYHTESAQRGDLVHLVTAVGSLAPMDAVEIGSDLSGKVIEVAVRVNDPVKAGDVLVRLDPWTFENAVAQSRAQVAAASASVKQAQVTLRQRELERDRAQVLAQRGAGTRVDEENAQLAYESAQAALAMSEAQLAQQRVSLARAQDQLADTVITSPIDGVVTQRLVEPGQTVVSSMAATALLEVASDLRSLKAEVDVDEAEVGRVAIGQPASFTVSAWPEARFSAVVNTLDLSPDASSSVVVYAAELGVRNDEMNLRPGMTATAEIEVSRRVDQLLVPSAALRYRPEGAARGEGEAVYLLQGGAPVRVAVEVIDAEGAWTAVQSSALSEGAALVTGEAR